MEALDALACSTDSSAEHPCSQGCGSVRSVPCHVRVSRRALPCVGRFQVSGEGGVALPSGFEAMDGSGGLEGGDAAAQQGAAQPVAGGKGPAVIEEGRHPDHQGEAEMAAADDGRVGTA